jgi:Ca-activated chloride channel homolog
MQRIGWYCVTLFSLLAMGFTWGDLLARNAKKGNDLFRQGQYDQAMQAYTEADVNSTANDPRLPQLYQNMGNTLTQQGQYEQAIAMYQKALAAEQNAEAKADLQYNTGNAYLKQRNYQKAVEAYRQALELNPQHAPAQQNKAMAEKLIVQPPPQQQQQQQEQEKKDDKEQQQQRQQSQAESPQATPTPSDQNQQQQQQTPSGQEQNQPESKEDQLSKEEALRILDALKEKEKLLKENMQLPPRPVEKDW